MISHRDIPTMADASLQHRLQVLAQRLNDTEAEIERLSDGQIDAIMSPACGPILLRQARESERISEQRFRAVFDHALDAMVVADDNGRYIDANAAASDLFGLSKFELLGRHVADFAVAQEDTDTSWHEFQSDGTMRGEFVLVRPDGGRRIAEFSAVSNIIPGHHLSVLRDVTARKDAEGQLRRLSEELQAQAQQLQLVMDLAPMGLLVLDQDSRTILANARAEANLRLVAGVGMGDIIRQLGGRPLQEFLKAAEEGTLPLELIIDHPIRRVFTVLANPIALPGEASGWVLVLNDVTKEHEYHQHLERQERLATIGQLAAGIAHDFNNLLAVIMLQTQLIQRKPNLQPNDQKRLAVILDHGMQAGHLVQQILDFGRRSVMERRPMELVAALEEMVVLWQHTLPENIRIHLQSAQQGDYIVNADATRLRQALMNLVINARDAMKDGGELCITLNRLVLHMGDRAPLPTLEPGTWIAIAVRDTGMGIAEEILSHIFDPFFTTKGPGEGSGLGLAQVYGTVSQHGGFVGVQSQVGQGTTFTLYLPSAEPAAPALEPEAVEAAEIQAPQQQTILLVEDNPAVREATRAILETQGYRVLEAENGRQAMELFRAHSEKIALVLSDLVMPEMGGVELYRLLRHAGAEVKMMIITGYPLEASGCQLLEEGSMAWLHKPFSFQELVDKVRRTLRAEPAHT